MTFKLCANCKLPMLRKTYASDRGCMERPSQYARRKTCGHRCAVELRKKKVKHTPCRQCGSLITRKRKRNGQIESASTFKRRKFCDAECAALWHEERGISWIAARMRQRMAA